MILLGQDYATRLGLTVHFERSTILSVGRSGATPAIIGPGFVDLQVNGFRGLDFNTLPVPDDLPSRVTRELWKEGVTSYFPAVVTNGDEEIGKCVRAIARACERDADAAAGIAGIHLEGPFISPENGPRGAHPKEHVGPPDWGRFQRWQEAAGGRIRIVTLSPEWPGSAAFIETCAGSGVTVSIGHTAASPEQIRDAVAAGATMSTHLGNGSHLLLPRHANYLWEQLAQDSLAACIIPDGFHLPDPVIKVVLRTKGRRAMLVSDSVYLAGLEPGNYRTHIGGEVTLTPEGRLHLAGEPGILAGSAQSLRHGVGRLARSGLAGLREAWEMASTRPAAAMTLPARAGIKAGAPADLVLFEHADGGPIRILETWKAGRRVYAAEVR